MTDLVPFAKRLDDLRAELDRVFAGDRLLIEGLRAQVTDLKIKIGLRDSELEDVRAHLRSAQCVIRQVARDTFGRDMTVKEFADASGYDS